MFKYYFEQIHNVAIWPIISLSIFFAFFIGLIIWVWKVDKSYIDEMKNLPIDKSNKDKKINFNLKILLLPLLMFSGIFSSQAQSLETLVSQEDMNMIVISMVMLVLVLVLIVAFYLLRILSIMVEEDAKRKAVSKGVTFIKAPSEFSIWWKGLTDAVPLEKEHTIVLDHNYDGIRELDNHLPPWWKWLFNASIVFAVVYMLVYHVFEVMPLQTAEYENDMAYAASLKVSTATTESAIDESNITASDDPTVISNGRTTYERSCVACHKSAGEGGIGPNLTDEYWLHGGTITDTYNTIKNGVPDKGMIAWKDVLSPTKIYEVNAYIFTLRGTKPANSKAPQGIEEEEAETE